MGVCQYHIGGFPANAWQCYQFPYALWNLRIELVDNKLGALEDVLPLSPVKANGVYVPVKL